MPKLICSLFLLLIGAILAGCSPSAPLTSQAGESSSAPAETSGKLVITGSSTCAPVIAEMAQRYEAAHPNVRIDVQTGGSSRGIADAKSGLADIGMVSRELKPEESDLLAFAFANDGVCMIVHRDNPIGELTDEQIKSIYTGRTTNWRDIGGDDVAITVVNKAEGRSTLELFLHYFQLDTRDIKPHVVIGDNEQGVKTVAGNPGAIGYVSIGTAEYDAAHGVPIKLLPIGGVDATIENVAAGKFPLSRPLNLVVKEAPTGLAGEFLKFAQSSAVHDLLEEQYFVPLAK